MRLNVTQLNNQIKAIVENHFEMIEVEAEISQVTYHSSGHIYFSIKDENSTISCAMWKSSTRNLKFKLEKGQKVIIYGALNVYIPRGEYKLIASKITPSGVGDLQFAFEQLKKELQQKGYFEKNKQLPKYPKNVAIITANPSAGLSDMLKIASKRWPLVKFYIYNSLVQGENAKFDISKNISLADKNNHEVIVIARGGGSLEDLWSFNTIEVAEVIFQVKTPIISAIGHEVDVLISDYVADVRASTPSNAMEILLPDINEHFFMIDDLKTNFIYKTANVLHKKADNLKNIKNLYRQNSIQNQFQWKFEELKMLLKNFDDKMENLFRHKKIIIPKKEEFNSKLENIIKSKTIMLNSVKEFQPKIEKLFYDKNIELQQIKENFKMLNPENREKKGFVEITQNGKKIDILSLKKGNILKISNTKKEVEVKVL